MTRWCLYMYICVRVRVRGYVFYSLRLWSLENDGRHNFWRDVRQSADLKPQGFSTFQRKNLRYYPSASSSNLIAFNSASQFREIYWLKRETRPPRKLHVYSNSMFPPSRKLKLLSITWYLSHTGIQSSFIFFYRLHVRMWRCIGIERKNYSCKSWCFIKKVYFICLFKFMV